MATYLWNVYVEILQISYYSDCLISSYKESIRFTGTTLVFIKTSGAISRCLCTKWPAATGWPKLMSEFGHLKGLVGTFFYSYYEFQNALPHLHSGRVKRICVFEHTVMINFNCARPAIQRGQWSGFLSEGSSLLTACMSEQQRFWPDCVDAQARLNLRCSHRQ